jgi:hypothetical protein
MDLFWNDMLLTKAIGFFTEFVSQGDVFRSTGASWDIKPSSDKKLLLKGTWKVLPIRQYWIVEIISGTHLFVLIDTQITSGIPMEYNSIIMMLTNEYKRWITPEDEGAFPERFFDLYGQRLIGIGQEHGRVGVKSVETDSGRLPSIHFELLNPKEEYLSQVTNTDRFSLCRTLQFSRITERSRIEKDTCFSAQVMITIEEEEDAR